MKLTSLLGLTAELLSKINLNFPPDKIVAKFFRDRKYLGSHDRKFISESLFGVLRWKKLLEYYFEIISTQENLNEFYDKNKGIILIFSYLYLINKNNEYLNYQFESEFIYLEQYKTKLINLIKTNSFNGNIAIELSHPDWLIDELKNNYSIDEIINICKVNNKQAPITLRTNLLKINREELQKELAIEKVETNITKYSPCGLNLEKRINVFQLKSFKKGYFEVQDEGSQIISLLANPKPGDKIIDVCSGAGGKSLAMAAQMNNRGEIFGFDIIEKKLDEFKKRIKRAGVDIIKLNHLKENILPKKFNEFADILLIDSPCSGIGTLRRNPGLKWSVTPKIIDEINVKQKLILQNYSTSVKVNGKLIYATCSILKKENEDIIQNFMRENKNFEIEDPKQSLKYYKLENLVTSEYLKLYPHIHNTDGFFAAVLKRNY
ncbi:MAG: methyltransferase domain-containing protein [Bacteroidetes bacterium]|nr:methyltransferase domain-containing protein [Bacteroidota bacterium]